jgi:hypothetical protein
MPIKIIKAETVDQVISQFNEWESRAIEEKNEEIRAQLMLATMQNRPPPMGLMVMALQLNPSTWKEEHPYHKGGEFRSGWVLSFLHNHKVD